MIGEVTATVDFPDGRHDFSALTLPELSRELERAGYRGPSTKAWQNDQVIGWVSGQNWRYR